MKLPGAGKLKLKLRETSYSRPNSAQETFERRMAVFGVIIIIAVGALFTRLWFMQVVGGVNYRKMAEGNRIRELSLEAPRGSIMDRNGEVVVRNRNALSISVVPAELGGDEKVIGRLSRLLDMSEEEIELKIEKAQSPNQRTVLIKSDVDEGVITYICEHQREFQGVLAGTTHIRDYPWKELAAHTIGYLGEISPEELEKKKDHGYSAGDEIGLSGVERTYDESLRGKVGKYRLEVDASGNAIRVLSRVEPRSGMDLRLTIDMDIQRAAEDALAAQVEVSRRRYHSETRRPYTVSGGSVVVMDPGNGEVLAMASYPTFDLNEFVDGISVAVWEEMNQPESFYPLNNRAIMSELPPGSIFKPVTALAGLKEGLAAPDSSYLCEGVFTEGAFEDYPKRCWKTHGPIDFFNSMVESCDIAFYHIGNSMYQRQLAGEGRALWDYAVDFRLGRTTGIDLISEMKGRVPTPEWKKEFNQGNPDYQVWYPGDTVNMAIGQGDVLATPLQMATIYGAIATGQFVRPHLMKSMEDEDGNILMESTTEIVEVLEYDQFMVEQVKHSLNAVVHGHGTAADTFDGFPLELIPVAGKTGTSEIVGKQPTAWFACYAPVTDPRYVVVVALEEGGHGGESAAPVARRVLEGIFGITSQGEIRPSTGD